MPLGLRRAGALGACALFVLLVACLCARPASARLAVAATGDGSVAIVDLGAKRVVARPVVGLVSRDAALTRDGLRAAAVSSDSATGRLSIVDLVTKGLIAQVVVSAGARGVAVSPDGARAYVTSGGSSGQITVVDM